jgi:hypothetical protein
MADGMSNSMMRGVSNTQIYVDFPRAEACELEDEGILGRGKRKTNGIWKTENLIMMLEWKDD